MNPQKGKGWHGERKRHSEVQKKGANRSTLRQPMKKQNTYYHAGTTNKVRPREIKPSGYYEKITASGCPEHRDFGFVISSMPETSFSKSLVGCLMAMKESEKDSIIDVFITHEEPDIDISDCGMDFGILEEVRYRRTVKIEYYGTFTLKKEFLKQIRECYGEGREDEEYGSTDTGGVSIYDTGLDCLKKHLINSLKKGTTVKELPNDKYTICEAKGLGMSLQQFQNMEKMYEEY